VYDLYTPAGGGETQSFLEALMRKLEYMDEPELIDHDMSRHLTDDFEYFREDLNDESDSGQ
jgi:hypothetical protein